MSYDTGVPNASQSPGLFPTQGQTNFGRLKTLFNVDHKFNDSAAANDGYHKIVHWITNGSEPSGINGTGQTYTFNTAVKRAGADTTSAHLWHVAYDGTTTVRSPLSAAPIRAYVNFDGQTAGDNAAQTIRSSFNVTSVTRIGLADGLYQITFTSALPSSGYAVVATGKFGSVGGDIVCGSIRTDVSYAVAVTTTTLQVIFQSSFSSGSGDDVSMGNVIVVGG